MKRVQSQQRNEQVSKYNEAVTKWEKDFNTWGIRLKTFFTDKEIPTVWDAIKEERDNLDLALYMLTTQNQGTIEDSLKLIKKISNMTIELSQRMLRVEKYLNWHFES